MRSLLASSRHRILHRLYLVVVKSFLGWSEVYLASLALPVELDGRKMGHLDIRSVLDLVVEHGVVWLLSVIDELIDVLVYLESR